MNKQQQEKLKRYQYIYDQLSSAKYTEGEVIEQVQRIFEGVSHSQAIQDLRCSKEIFSTTLKIHKLFEIKLQIDRLKFILFQQLYILISKLTKEKNTLLV